MEWVSAAYTAAALVCATAACVVALAHIYRHLLHYAEPIYQRFIVRIISMAELEGASRSLAGIRSGLGQFAGASCLPARLRALSTLLGFGLYVRCLFLVSFP